MRMRASLLGLLTATLSALPAAADTTIRTNSSDHGQATIYISGSRVAMDNAGDQHTTIYDGSAERMTFVDHGQRQYQRIGREQMEQIAQQMQRMREQFRKQLQTMPEDQREEMRKQMESMMPGAGEPPEIRVEPTGGTTTVAGTSCRQARVYRDGELAHEVCVAAPEAAGIARDDFDTITAMFGFFERMMGPMGGAERDIGPRTMTRLMQQMGGMPLRARNVDGGSRWEITGVSSDAVPDDRFAIPDGYSKGKSLGDTMQ